MFQFGSTKVLYIVLITTKSSPIKSDSKTYALLVDIVSSKSVEGDNLEFLRFIGQISVIYRDKLTNKDTEGPSIPFTWKLRSFSITNSSQGALYLKCTFKLVIQGLWASQTVRCISLYAHSRANNTSVRSFSGETSSSYEPDASQNLQCVS